MDFQKNILEKSVCVYTSRDVIPHEHLPRSEHTRRYLLSEEHIGGKNSVNGDRYKVKAINIV